MRFCWSDPKRNSTEIDGTLCFHSHRDFYLGAGSSSSTVKKGQQPELPALLSPRLWLGRGPGLCSILGFENRHDDVVVPDIVDKGIVA